MPPPPVQPAFSQRDLDEARLDLLRRRVAAFGLVIGLILIALGLLAAAS